VNDSAWTTLRFATIARKQQVTNVTMTSLARIANAVVMDPRDAFTKLRYRADSHQRQRAKLVRCYPFVFTAQTNDGLDRFENQRYLTVFLAKACGNQCCSPPVFTPD
jgi:hypothetical protein